MGHLMWLWDSFAWFRWFKVDWRWLVWIVAYGLGVAMGALNYRRIYGRR